MARVDGRKRLAGTLFCFVTGHAVVLESEYHVIEDCGRDELRIGILENEANLLPCVRLVILGYRRPVDDEFAVVGDECRVQMFE